MTNFKLKRSTDQKIVTGPPLDREPVLHQRSRSFLKTHEIGGGDLQRPTTAKKDASGRSCPGVQSIGATRRHTVQELDVRRALPARILQPGHPSTTDIHPVAALMRGRSEEGRCQGRPVFQAPARPGPDRQDSAHAPLTSHQLRPQRHGHFDVPARAPLPKRLRWRRALIIFANDKELTEKESILALAVIELGQAVARCGTAAAKGPLAAQRQIRRQTRPPFARPR